MGVWRGAAAFGLVAALLSACSSSHTPTPAPTQTTGLTPSATPSEVLPGAATTEVGIPSSSFGALTGVRVGHHPGFDRVVFEFASAVPGYTVRYVDLPIFADGSGEPVALPGAAAAVEITFTPASGFDQNATPPAATYKGLNSVSSDKTVKITSAVLAGDFEATLSWAVGLRDEVPFLVTKLSGPARLVVDFRN